MDKNFEPEYITEKNRSYNLDEIEEAIENKIVLESLAISCDANKTLTLNLGTNIVGRIKFDEIEYKIDGSEVKSIAAISRVGRHVKYIPTNLSRAEDGKIIVECSRRLAQLCCYEHKISKLIPGDIVNAKIVKIEKYGVFCDIGCGIVALLPTNYISVTHIVDPRLILDNLKTLRVIIKQIQDDGKIQLTHKELLGTWEQEVAKFEEGQTVCGSVITVQEYGVFIRISQNLSGLANLPSDMKIHPGDIVSVHISAISSPNMKVKLNIIDKIEGSSEKMSFNYYIKGNRIDDWVYTSSLNNSDKRVIETHFRVTNMRGET